MIARQEQKNKRRGPAAESWHNTEVTGCGNEKAVMSVTGQKMQPERKKSEEREPDLYTITDAGDMKVIKLKSLLQARR